MCLPSFLSTFLPVYLHVCLPVWLFVCVSLCLSVYTYASCIIPSICFYFLLAYLLACLSSFQSVEFFAFLPQFSLGRR